jgi:hypothetical protein
MADRDDEAYRVIAQRSFERAALAGVRVDMTTRRTTVVLYGPLQGGSTTYLATVTFFGTDAFTIASEAGAFPRGAQLSRAQITYAESADDASGTARFEGRSGWTLAFAFDGVSYEEHPAVLASLADEIEDDA